MEEVGERSCVEEENRSVGGSFSEASTAFDRNCVASTTEVMTWVGGGGVRVNTHTG